MVFSHSTSVLSDDGHVRSVRILAGDVVAPHVIGCVIVEVHLTYQGFPAGEFFIDDDVPALHRVDYFKSPIHQVKRKESNSSVIGDYL